MRPEMRHRSATVVVVLAILVGCDWQASGETTFRGFDSLALSDSVYETLRIPSKAAEYAFGEIVDLEVDDGGRIYALDAMLQTVHVFDPDGAYVRSIARSGRGPEELEGAFGLSRAPDGNIWVIGTTAYTVFDTSGTFVERFPRLVRGIVTPWAGGFLRDGAFLDWGGEREVAGIVDADGFRYQAYSGRATLYPIAATPGSSLDTFPPLEFSADVSEDGQLKWYGRELKIALHPSGRIWFAESDNYRLVGRNLNGDTIGSFWVSGVKAARVPAGEVDSTVRHWRRRGFPVRADLFTKHKPVVGEIVAAQDLVYVFPQELGFELGSVIDIFSPTGDLKRRLRLPQTVVVDPVRPVVAESRLYAVILDELDVPSIVRFRLGPSTAPTSP